MTTVTIVCSSKEEALTMLQAHKMEIALFEINEALIREMNDQPEPRSVKAVLGRLMDVFNASTEDIELSP